jgi:hypothetical protein
VLDDKVMVVLHTGLCTMSDNPRDVTQFSSNLAYKSSPLVKYEDNVAYGIGSAGQPQVHAWLL